MWNAGKETRAKSAGLSFSQVATLNLAIVKMKAVHQNRYNEDSDEDDGQNMRFHSI